MPTLFVKAVKKNLKMNNSSVTFPEAKHAKKSMVKDLRK
jgi:hypothetical protein